jgi:hypothetical protein
VVPKKHVASVDPNFANLTDMTPLNPPFEGGKFSPPSLEGELEGVNLDLLGIEDSLWILKRIALLVSSPLTFA